MRNWTLEQYQELKREGVEKLSNDDFHSLALKQMEFFPDMLEICEKETILEIFYSHYNRRFKRQS